MSNNRHQDHVARSVGELMSESRAGFGRILKRARALERLNDRVADLLDPDLAAHCRVANLRDRCLVFVCTSPSCATRLRMQAPELVNRLHTLGLKDIEGIVVKMTQST